MKAFLSLQHGGTDLGTLHLVLYEDTVPRTVRNFATLLQRSQPEGYLQSTFHRIIPGFMAQGGDFTNQDGTGGFSIFGKTFEDEAFVHSHSKRSGVLSMANAGPHTNGSQFFVTFRPAPHLDHKHVVFGHVDLTRSADVLEALENVSTDATDRPRQPVTIVKGGIVQESKEETTPSGEIRIVQNANNEEEIELDDEEDDVGAAEDEPEDETDIAQPTTKAEALKLRLRKLKQKMNQARQLNQQAVQQEGERLSRQDAERRKQHAKDKQREQEEWESRHAKALETAQLHGIDGKHLTQQALNSLSKAQIRAEKAEASQHSSRDYHNPEGQALNYQRNLKSLPKRTSNEAAATTSTYIPLDHHSNNEDAMERERQGARRLADELHRRIDKQKAANLQKRGAAEDDGETTYINKRNKLFNERIKRNYDSHTAEIRQNLERGTAL